MNKLHVKKDDTVVVISGDDKGKKGKVLKVSPAERKIIVDGVNVVKSENCGIVIREEKVAALGHKPGAFITEKQASCGETGLKTQKCETCGVTLAEEIVPEPEKPRESHTRPRTARRSVSASSAALNFKEVQ